jgi:hypothetical protein
MFASCFAAALSPAPTIAQEQILPDSAPEQDVYALQLAVRSRAQRAEAMEWALRHQAPIRCDNGRRICELVALWDGRPVYYVTANLNAAISLQTDRVRDLLPWDLDGEGIAVGVWDAAGVRKTHQEFQGPDGQSRVTIRDSFVTSAHSTHVAGTIGATGVVPSAKGMAPGVRIESDDWNDDASQMNTRAARVPGQPNAIYISNHSYGILVGWEYHATDSLSGYIGWHWWGAAMGPNAVEGWFGRYSSIASTWDQTAYTNPYYLAFTSAGNDRCDGPNVVGETVYYRSGGGWHDIAYSPDTCPRGEGQVKGGYDTISFFAVAKNVVTVGAVQDAVSRGVRSLSHAAMTDFSCWGPTDDGRIKPDLVANGVGVFSTTHETDDAYDGGDGTSMASPVAAGSAALLIQHYERLFPGQFMRASTLKGLILHTADDLGRPGPDYEFGWGLMNTKAAVELITKQHDATPGATLLEGVLDPSLRTHSYYLYSRADEPIRVTLCWTDPPCASTNSSDDPSSRLIHDLDLRIAGPSGSTLYCPYVLDPFDPNAPAWTGDNSRDNVEQVCILTPSEQGLYKIEVSYKGSLRYNDQHYSLISSQPLFAGHPPEVCDTTAFTSSSDPVTIALAGQDDGLPDPPGALTFTVASLPEHGVLKTVQGDTIAEPRALANHGNQVVYQADAGFSGDDGFTYYIDDGGTRPSGGRSETATVTTTVANLLGAEYQVCASNDDAYGSSGYQLASGRFLWLGQDTTAVRFRDVAVPQGSTIFSAHLKLYTEATVKVEAVVRAEAAGDTLDFAKSNPKIWERPQTVAETRWDWQGTGPDEQWHTSPNIAQVVQEVVCRPDWSSGNALVLLYSGQKFSSQGTHFCSWDADPTQAPRLEIVYSPPLDVNPESPPSLPGQSPPSVQDIEICASPCRPLSIALEGRDDGLPMALLYTLASLPEHGRLSDRGAPITEPTTLADGIDRVIYTPDADFTGDDSFTFYADDGGARPRGGTSNTATVTVRVRHMVTRQYQVVAAADDASGADGNPVVYSETLTVGKHGSAMRFRNVDIPPGSEIVSARLLICMDTAVIGKPVEGLLQAEAVADAPDFTGGNRRIFGLLPTAASVPWTWQVGDAWSRLMFCASPDIRPVIQEVVDHPGWLQGNALAILYLPVAYHGQDLAFFACDEASGDRAARLEVTYAPNPEAEPLPPLLGDPPTAHDMEVETPVNAPLTIRLDATDDGLPESPGQLTCQIVSLPEHGTLEHPDGTHIENPTRLKARVNLSRALCQTSTMMSSLLFTIRKIGRAKSQTCRDILRLARLDDLLSQAGAVMMRASPKATLWTAGIAVSGRLASYLGLPGFTRIEALLAPVVVGGGLLALGAAMRYVPRALSGRLATIAEANDLNLMEDYRKSEALDHLNVLWDSSSQDPWNRIRSGRGRGFHLNLYEDFCDGAYFDPSDTKIPEQYAGNVTRRRHSIPRSCSGRARKTPNGSRPSQEPGPTFWPSASPSSPPCWAGITDDAGRNVADSLVGDLQALGYGEKEVVRAQAHADRIKREQTAFVEPDPRATGASFRAAGDQPA